MVVKEVTVVRVVKDVTVVRVVKDVTVVTVVKDGTVVTGKFWTALRLTLYTTAYWCLRTPK
jgi:hypothetical protein